MCLQYSNGKRFQWRAYDKNNIEGRRHVLPSNNRSVCFRLLNALSIAVLTVWAVCIVRAASKCVEIYRSDSFRLTWQSSDSVIEDLIFSAPVLPRVSHIAALKFCIVSAELD